MLPIQIELLNKKVLIIGGGNIGFRKAKVMTQQGAIVKVIAPTINNRIYELENCMVVQKAYEVGDESSFFIVIAATNDVAVNELIYKTCYSKGILCHTVSHHTHSDFSFLSTEQKGDLLIAVGTNGKNPTFAKWMLNKIMRCVNEEYIKKLFQHTKLREVVLNNVPNIKERKKILKDALSFSNEQIQAYREELGGKNEA